MASKLGLAAAIGGWSARHRKTAVIGWLLFVVLASVIGGSTGMVKATSAENTAGETRRAAQILEAAGIAAPAAETVLVQTGSGSSGSSDDADFRAAVADVIAAVNGTGLVSDVHSPYDSGAISADRRSALVDFAITGDKDKAVDHIEPVLAAVAATQAKHQGLRIEEFGEATGMKFFKDSFTNDFKRAEWTAVPLALGILLVAFGALVAAILPVGLAITAYTGAAGLLALSSHWLHTTDDAASVMLLIGLAVGVDYCLFYLRREREERAAGHDNETALRIAAATSGRAVLVSGLTVVAAMAGMFFTGITDFTAIGMATILVVVVAVLGSLTVLPALLSMLGDRVGKGRIPGLGRRGTAVATESRVWRFILGGVLRRPLGSALLAGGALLALAAPVLTLHTAQLNFTQELSPDSALVQTAQRIDAAFPGSPAPARIVVSSPNVDTPEMRTAIDNLRRAAVATGMMHDPITVTYHLPQHIAVIDVPLAGNGNDKASENALDTLRGSVIPPTIGAVPGTETAVSGSTAGSVDFTRQLSRSNLPVFAFVLVLAFLLMLVSFRSVVVAGTAVVLNLISVGAAYGVLALIFQHGVGAALFGTHAVGAIQSWMPLFLFVILFGLSMDYHVFVVSRIKEGHDRGLTTRAAVAHGITSTAGVVTSAAVIMVAVFAIFGTLTVQSMKQTGVGLAVAVLIDATIIRGVLLPSVMTLLGDRNWYLPRWLGWLPALSHGEIPPVAPVPPVGEDADRDRQPVTV
ncbi:MAG TPA: MMPL family transporter [Mycobacteriales bacterium]|nr:MMPL family transporter [Mycobacteriales bacterium]